MFSLLVTNKFSDSWQGNGMYHAVTVVSAFNMYVHRIMQ